MNHWKEIWNAYHEGATRKKILKDIWQYSKKWDKFYLTSIFLVFLTSVFMNFYQGEYWLILIVTTESAILLKLNSLKQNLIMHEYGGTEQSQTPPNSVNHQSTRYLIFKNMLVQKEIPKSAVEGCFNLVDLQIDIAATDASGIKRVSSFSMGILTGILTALWKELHIKELIIISLSIIGTVLLIDAIASVFPSKLEKLKELKYFMLLYCRETQ